MKKIEKELLLLDLENGITQYERRLKILDNIIIFYVDEDTTDEIKEESNIDSKSILDENLINDKNDIDSDEKELSLEIENKPKKEDLLPKDIKIIYRKIMMITHPDKTLKNNNRKEYSNFYKDAVNAKNNNDKAELIYIAYKLNIKDVFEINDEHFGNIKYKIAKLNMDTKNIENSPYWVWYYTDNESLKKIMKTQIKNYHKF